MKRSKKIGNHAFFALDATRVELPEVIEIGEQGFSNSGLVELVAPKLEKLGPKAFQDSKNLKTQLFPALKEVKTGIFWGCHALTVVELPKLEKVDWYLFRGCNNIQQVTFHTLTSIGERLFFGIDKDANNTHEPCPRLARVIAPKATYIESQAFREAKELFELRLGATPPAVDNDAFQDAEAPGRFITLVDPDGNPLTGEALKQAQAAYDAADQATDGMWRGWELGANATHCNITLGEPANGTISATMDGKPFSGGQVERGARIQIAAIPNASYKAHSISYLGYTILPNEEGEFAVRATKNGTISALFIPAEAANVAVTLAAENGELKAKLEGKNFYGGEVAIGASLSLTPQPNDGYVLTSITYLGQELKPNNQGAYSVVITAAGEIKATFERAEDKTVTYAAPNAADGTLAVTTQAGDEVRSGATVPRGTVLKINAEAAANRIIKSLTINEQVKAAEVVLAQETFTVGADNVNIEVAFEEAFEITIANVENCTIKMRKEGQQEYITSGRISTGTKLIVEATPAPDYSLKEVSFADAPITPTDGVYTFTVDKAGTISAKVESKPKHAITWTLTPDTDGTLEVKNGETSIASGDQIAEGNQLTLKVTAKEGKIITKLTIGTEEIVEAKKLRVYTKSITVTAPVAIAVEFGAAAQLQINLPAQDQVQHGTLSVTMDGELFNGGAVNEGSILTITVTPAANYKLKSLKLDNTELTVVNGKCELIVTQSGTISLTFVEKEKFPITLSITGEDKGTIRVIADGSNDPLDLNQPVYEETLLTIIANAKEGNYVAALAVNGESVPVEGKPEGMQKSHKVAAPVAITATFAAREATVEEFTISFDTPTHGSITVADANGNVTSGAKVAKGTEITITAKPSNAETHELASIKVNNQEKINDLQTDGTLKVTVNENITIAAEFKEKQQPAVEEFTISFDTPPHGSITVADANGNVASGAKVPKGAEITITAKPSNAETHELTSIKVNNQEKINDLQTDGTLKVTVNENITIAAEFKEKQQPAVEEFEVTIAKAENGTIKVMNGKEEFKAGKVAKGTKLEIVATPKNGYTLDKITFEKEPIKANEEGKYFIVVTKNGTIKASFAKKQSTPVESLLFAGVVASPNPCTTELHLEQIANAERVSILSLAGQNLRSVPCYGQESMTIDLSDLPSGIYVLLVERGAERRLIRVVKL